jgi:hypothetical protein
MRGDQRALRLLSISVLQSLAQQAVGWAVCWMAAIYSVSGVSSAAQSVAYSVSGSVIKSATVKNQFAIQSDLRYARAVCPVVSFRDLLCQVAGKLSRRVGSTRKSTTGFCIIK